LPTSRWWGIGIGRGDDVGLGQDLPAGLVVEGDQLEVGSRRNPSCGRRPFARMFGNEPLCSLATLEGSTS
jgi:hypothetical protein